MYVLSLMWTCGEVLYVPTFILNRLFIYIYAGSNRWDFLSYTIICINNKMNQPTQYYVYTINGFAIYETTVYIVRFSAIFLFVMVIYKYCIYKDEVHYR